MNHADEKTKQSTIPPTRTDRSVYLHRSRSIVSSQCQGGLKENKGLDSRQLSPLLCLAWENAEAIKRVTGVWRVEVWRRPQVPHPKWDGNGCGEMFHIEPWRCWPSWEAQDLSQWHLPLLGPRLMTFFENAKNSIRPNHLPYSKQLWSHN